MSNFDGDGVTVFGVYPSNRHTVIKNVLASNKSTSQWKEDFDEDDPLLCALDRIFDNAIVYMMDGKSYRGRKLETIAVKVGSTSDLLDPVK